MEGVILEDGSVGFKAGGSAGSGWGGSGIELAISVAFWESSSMYSRRLSAEEYGTEVQSVGERISSAFWRSAISGGFIGVNVSWVVVMAYAIRYSWDVYMLD